MNLQVELAKSGRVMIRGVAPELDESGQDFGWVEVPGDLLAELHFEQANKSAPLEYSWLFVLGHWLAKYSPPPAKRQSYNTWALAVKSVATLLRSGAVSESQRLLELYYKTLAEDLVLDERRTGVVLISKHGAARAVRSHTTQRDLLLRAATDRELLRQILAAGESYQARLSHKHSQPVRRL